MAAPAFVSFNYGGVNGTSGSLNVVWAVGASGLIAVLSTPTTATTLNTLTYGGISILPYVVTSVNSTARAWIFFVPASVLSSLTPGNTYALAHTWSGTTSVGVGGAIYSGTIDHVETISNAYAASGTTIVDTFDIAAEATVIQSVWFQTDAAVTPNSSQSERDDRGGGGNRRAYYDYSTTTAQSGHTLQLTGPNSAHTNVTIVLHSTPSSADPLEFDSPTPTTHPHSALSVLSTAPATPSHPTATLAAMLSAAIVATHPTAVLGLSLGAPLASAHPTAAVSFAPAEPNAASHPRSALTALLGAPSAEAHPSAALSALLASPAVVGHPQALLAPAFGAPAPYAHPKAWLTLAFGEPTPPAHPEASLMTDVVFSEPTPYDHPLARLSATFGAPTVGAHPQARLSLAFGEPLPAEHPQAALELTAFERAPIARLNYVQADRRIQPVDTRSTMTTRVHLIWPGELLRYGNQWAEWLAESSIEGNAIEESTWAVEKIVGTSEGTIVTSGEDATDDETALDLELSPLAVSGEVFEVTNDLLVTSGERPKNKFRLLVR